MGLAEIWERWFGPAAEINYGAPLADTPLIVGTSMQYGKRANARKLKIAFASEIDPSRHDAMMAKLQGQPGLIKPTARRKSRKRGKQSNTHGKASSKSKSRSRKAIDTRTAEDIRRKPSRKRTRK